MPQEHDTDSNEAPKPQSEAPTPGDAGTREEQAAAAAPYVPKFKPLWENVITIAGIFLTAVAVLLLLTFGLFSLVSPSPNPYVDIFGFLVLPSVLIVGVVIIPLGILIKSWRVRRIYPQEHLTIRFPRIDLNDPAQRRVAKVVLLCAFILLPVVGVSAYHGYHYTDSADFCANACHSVMKPQATTYEYSAHARVPCADCHIGAGADWFVKSKLSGTRQVIAVWRDSYPRPIPPAITNLRPARETCEQCHWPKKFFGAQLREIVHFASDEANTRREIDMLLKTGGGDATTGRAEGIHLHMALQGQIRYIATDEKLQVIPWVEYTDKSGKRLIYRSDGRPSSDPRPEGEERVLDCMDCHNRPAHKFRSPQEALDIYLDVGKIDTTLPFIKREATKVLVHPYPDDETANAQMGARLTEFYRSQYPEVWRTRKAPVNGAIDEARAIYAQNFFPEMKVNWQTYPDNIGHLISPGCFRCHDGSHVNQNGKRLSHQCHICHDFLNPIEHAGGGTAIQAGEFVHPYELEGPHVNLRCDRCHTGGLAPDPTCAGCHSAQAELRAGTTLLFEPYGISAEPMADTVGCEDCHDLDEPTDIETIGALCLDCHDDEEERFDGLLAEWQDESDALLREADQRTDADGKAVLQALREAGPLHNFEAARTICQALIGEPTSQSSDYPTSAP